MGYECGNGHWTFLLETYSGNGQERSMLPEGGSGHLEMVSSEGNHTI